MGPHLLSLPGSWGTYLACFPIVMPLNETFEELAQGQFLFFFLNISFIEQYEFWYVRMGEVSSELISKKKQHKHMLQHYRTLKK